MDAQKKHNVGIFSCDASLLMKKPGNNDASTFTKAWWQIKDDGTYLKHDWTVKITPQAVFFPERLQKHLAKLSAPSWPGQIYLKTIKLGVGVVPDFIVLSKNAVSEYFKHKYECEKKIKK